MAYFNNLPSYANPLFAQGALASQRAMDVRRQQFDLDMKWKPKARVSPFFAVLRTNGDGSGVTPFVGSGDEFPVYTTFGDTLTTVRGGAQLTGSLWSATLELGRIGYTDQQELNSTGNAGNRTDDVTLDRLAEKYDASGDGLFTRALQQASSTNAGFDARGVEVASIDASLGRDGDAAGPSVTRELLDRVRHIPGVASASMSRMLPLANEAMGMGLWLPGEVPRPGALEQTAGSGNIVAPGYFATLRIPIRAGRDFIDQDAAGAPLVVIVGEAAARRFWPGEDPIGKQLVLNGGSRPGASIRVVGVAHDVRYRALDFGPVPYVYLPLGQHDTSNLSLIVRSADGRSMAGGVRAAIAGMGAAPQAVSLQSLDDLVAVALTPQRVGAFVAGGLGLVGVLLAAIGIYGVTAYTVSRRTREIAIRTALGAQRGTVVGLVLRQAISLTAIGCAIGLVLGAVAGQVLSMLLVGVSPLDPATLCGAVVVCAVVVLAGSFVPVSRVMKIEASHALRSE
jgi:predicted permease